MGGTQIYYCSKCEKHFYPFQCQNGFKCPDCGSMLLTDYWYCSECEMLEDEMGKPDPSQAHGYRMCPDHPID